MRDLVRLLQIGQEGIQHIAQSGSGVADAVGDVQPAARRFDGRRTLAVLHFFDRMVIALVHDGLAGNYSIFDRVG
ncbi:hypothetical protein D3C81_2268320 [compost metagenome]